MAGALRTMHTEPICGDARGSKGTGMKDQSGDSPDPSSEPHEQAGFDTEGGAQARSGSGPKLGSAGTPENRPTIAGSTQGASEAPSDGIQSAFGHPDGQHRESSDPPTNTTHTARPIPKWTTGVIVFGVAACVLYVGVSIGHTTSTATSATSPRSTTTQANTTSTYTSIPGHEGSNEGADLGNASGATGSSPSSSQDLTYSSILSVEGFRDAYGTESHGVGHTVCQALAAIGTTFHSVATRLHNDNRDTFDQSQATQIVDASIRGYCPQYMYWEHN